MNIVIANQYSELIKQLNISENIYYLDNSLRKRILKTRIGCL